MNSSALRPLKICLDGSPLIFPICRHRGLGRYTLALIRAFADLPEPPEMVVFDPVQETEVPIGPDVQLSQVTDSWLNVTSYSGLALFQSRLSYAYWRRKRPPGEVYLFPCADLTPWKMPPRSAAIVMDLITSCYAPWASSRQLGSLRDKLKGLRVTSAELLIAISQNTLRDASLVWGLSEKQIVAIPHLQLPLASPSETPSPRIQELRETDPGYLLFLGAREERKGIGPLLQLWEERHPREARLVLAGPEEGGDPDVEKRVHSLVRRGDVILLGHLSEQEKADVLRGARALLFPSRYEGYGLPVTEAMMAGVPVVTFRNSSIPEAAGEGGILLPDGDFQGLLECALELVRDPEARESAAQRARQRAALLDQQAVARGFLRALGQLRDGTLGSQAEPE